MSIEKKKKISTIIKVAFLQSLNLEQDQRIQQKSYLKGLLDKLNSTIDGISVIGNLVDEPEILYQKDIKIEEFNSKQYVNLLQYPIELNEAETKEIRNQIIEKLNSEKESNNWKFLFSHKELYNELEAQLRRDIENNPHEMIIIGQTIIVSKYFDEYERIKNQISPEKVAECFLYHGTKLSNHSKIAKMHFIMPDEDKHIKKLDGGYFGRGICASDDILYASLYSNGFCFLKVNEKACVLCCRAIYNKDKVKDLYDLSYYGKKIDADIRDNFGVHREKNI